MALYIISGKVNENCVIRIIQNEEYVAEIPAPKSPYSIYFEADGDEPITAAIENDDGMIVGFSDVKLVEVIKPNVLFKK